MSLRGTASGRLFDLPRALPLLPPCPAWRAAAPASTGTGALVLSLTAIGVTPSFDTRPDAAAARALRRCAGELSAQLGAPGRPQAA